MPSRAIACPRQRFISTDEILAISLDLRRAIAGFGKRVVVEGPIGAASVRRHARQAVVLQLLVEVRQLPRQDVRLSTSQRCELLDEVVLSLGVGSLLRHECDEFSEGYLVVAVWINAHHDSLKLVIITRNSLGWNVHSKRQEASTELEVAEMARLVLVKVVEGLTELPHLILRDVCAIADGNLILERGGEGSCFLAELKVRVAEDVNSESRVRVVKNNCLLQLLVKRLDLGDRVLVVRVKLSRDLLDLRHQVL
mmetsp:Transcript_33308/g.87328  ORF Transcript_33308/g.87328 Transcript_33308/m.87328 type:complete len:253 (+) Transcript_33308:1558-2316(+)